MRTSPRGEYWRLLLPGTYALTASHSNKFGRLEADITNLEILAQPGQGAVRRDLVLKLKLYQTFTVTTITTVGSPHCQEELTSLFKNCDIVKISTAEKHYVARFSTVPKPLTDEFSAFGVHPVVCCPEPLPDSSICFPSDPWCQTYEAPEYEGEGNDYDYLHQNPPTVRSLN